jgi:HSP90 family molecular chaperone
LPNGPYRFCFKNACWAGEDRIEIKQDAAVLKDYTDLLFDMAVLSEGEKLENPSRFSKLLGDFVQFP